MTAMNPDGALDSRNMTTGDMHCIARAYLRHIENIDTDEWHFLISSSTSRSLPTSVIAP
jgi:oxalate decarboxylase